jgi:hypothetical protein
VSEPYVLEGVHAGKHHDTFLGAFLCVLKERALFANVQSDNILFCNYGIFNLSVEKVPPPFLLQTRYIANHNILPIRGRDLLKKNHYGMGTEMQYLTIPGFQTLRGEDAIKALNDYVEELAEQKPEESADSQVKALTKICQSIDFFHPVRNTAKSIHRRQSVSFRKVRDAILPKLQFFKLE